MNCWKSINFSKQYGPNRLMIMSLVTMLFSFILLYIPFTYFLMPTSYYDNHFTIFVFGILFMHPLHNLLHYLPIAHLGNKVTMKLKMKYIIYPVLHIRVIEPISKWWFLSSLFMPIFMISFILIIAMFVFPNYVHYFTILMALNIGLSFSDFIFAKSILTSPRNAYIEESEEGFEILVYNS